LGAPTRSTGGDSARGSGREHLDVRAHGGSAERPIVDRRLSSLYVGQLLNNLALRNSEDVDTANVALVGALLIEHVSPAHGATVTRGDEFLGFELGVR
jgi:hypothetical protein